MTIAECYQATIPVPRAIRFPVELIPPEGFDPLRRETWPRVGGRLEYVGGRLLFMPPCGDRQQDTVTDTIGVLLPWVRAHREFVVSTNEAGTILGGEVQAAGVAVWRRADVGDYVGELRRVPPILAVEVAGDDEDEPALRDKAQWYLSRGVEIVWIVLPEARTVIVVDPQGEQRYRSEDVIPGRSGLPGLSAAVAEFFVQIDDR